MRGRRFARVLLVDRITVALILAFACALLALSVAVMR